MGEGKTTTMIRTKREKDLFTVEQKQRLKREDCHRTKHDSAFSKWQKILIGSSDWEDHRLGKAGAERYRIANLPNTTSSSSCPGIYELGVAHVDDGRDLRKLGPQRILVVYLGQAENVRTRLQHYGRAGSHLDHHNVDCLPPPPVGGNKNSSSNERSGFFQEVFARGFSIVFRWSPTKSKREAEEKEALLLQVFDYAWNKMGNGCCRRDDILLKLKRTLPPANPLDALFTNLKLLLKTRVGMDVKVGAPLRSCAADVDEPSGGTRIFKFLKSRPRLICEQKGKDSNVCGVVKADGSVCTNRPPKAGRKRCQEHRGRRKSSVVVNDKKYGEGRRGATCGLMLEDGSVCMALPPKGRKRCEAHKGRRRCHPHSPVKQTRCRHYHPIK